MQDVFLLCLVLGAGVLVVQILLGAFGVGDAPFDGDAAAADATNLLSVRAIAAGATLFGAVGMWLNGRGVPLIISLPAALAGGAAAAVATALLTRQLMRLESSGSLDLATAIGRSGTVYLPVPAHRHGYGKVQFTLQGRTVELRAVADEPEDIPTGTPVVVVGLMEDDTVEVMITPLIEGIDE